MMRRLIIKKNHFISALVMILVLVLSVPSIHAEAFNKDSIRGVAAIVFYLKNARLERTRDFENYEVCSDYYEELAYSSGSGFFIGEEGSQAQIMVTNCHVVQDYILSDNGGRVEIYWDKEQSGMTPYYTYLIADSCELRVYFEDDDYEIASVECYGDVNAVDLAVLKLNNPTDKRLALTIKEVSSDMVGEKIYTIGYPGNAENIFTNASKYGISDVSLSDGIISKFVRDKENNVERIQVTASIFHGNSGGPLVDEDGNVLGVNTNVFSQSPYDDQIEANYYSISSNELISFLDNNNITYQKYEDPETTGEPSITEEPDVTEEPDGNSDITKRPTREPVVTEVEDEGDSSEVPDPNRVTDEPGSEEGNGAPDIVKPDEGNPEDSSKPDKDSKSSDDDDDDRKSSDKSSDEGNNLGLIIGISAFAVFAAVVLILVIRSIKKDKSGDGNTDESSTGQTVGQTQKLSQITPLQPQTAQAIAVPAAASGGKKQRTGVLRLMTPQHNGALIPVDMNPVVIGRDASCCTVVFSEDTPGVSATHCQISFSASDNEFTLVDLGSTYGTYIIKTRSKLDPNVPVKLKVGDSFVLGDKTNVITLDVAKSI